MTSPLPQLRCERKFIGQRLSLAEVAALVRRHPALFREIYPPRTVNNIYLDSDVLRDYFDHVEGVANRVKTRIRWYGPLNGHIARPTLERKLKRGFVSGKAAHSLSAITLAGSLARPALDEALARSELPAALRMAVRHLRPALVNRYQRQYWLSACGRFRLTIDWNLQFSDPHASRLSANRVAAVSPGVILELKFDPQYMEGAAAISNALPLHLSRCSKYVLGIESLGLGHS